MQANTTELSSKRRLVLVKDRNDGQHVQFWVCTDGILLSQIVPLYQDSFPRNQLNKAMHPRWATDTCFWLAFVPRDLVFKGRLFESLKFPAPLVDSPFRLLDGSTGQHYKVSEEVGRKWSQLGIMLNELRSLLTLTIDALPPTIECPPAPSEHRYEKLFADRKSADEALDETRWSFILQMAYISCLYHLLPPPVTGLVWSQIPDGTKISLQSSWIFANDGRTTRVGAFVDTTQDGQWLQYFDTISSVPGLPLWLHYPTVSTTLAHPTFERYAPWTGFGPTWQGNRGNFDSEPSGWSAAPTPLHETQATFSPDEAFGHPAQRGASREQSPSPAMRRQGPSSYPSHRQRFQRGRGQSRSPRLVRDQSRGAGHRQSTRQEQGRSHSHLRQQSHRGSDERDLPLLREAQRSSASSVRAHQSPPLCPPPRYLSAGTHAFDPGRMSTAFRTLLANDKIVEDAITVDPILTVLQCRYGFKPDVSYISDKFAQEKRIKNSATFLHRILGFDIKNDNIPAALINAVDDFAGLLRHGFPPPVQLCDLMVDGRGDFVRALGSPMLATKVKLEALPDANPRDVYLIKPRDVEDAEDWPWHLIVESSLTAAEILRRRWGPHKASVVRELAKRGIPFRVALPAPSKQSLSLPPVTISGLNAGLGVRQPNFRTSKEEYLTFEDQRKDLLVNSPHAVQAALGAGGIIWRLTVNTLQPDLAAEGPRDRPDQQATVLLDGESYICDALTSHEEDLICGVYRVLACKLHFLLSQLISANVS